MPGNSSTKFELLELDPYWDEQGWRMARVAVDGIPSVPFQFHKSTTELYRTSDELLAYLCRRGAAMIERFGDAREVRPNFDDGRIH